MRYRDIVNTRNIALGLKCFLARSVGVTKMMKTKRMDQQEYESFGIQMRQDVRRKLNVKAAELDLHIREALEQAVLCWTSPTCPNQTGVSRAQLQDRIMAWLESPANETERGLADIVVRLANGRA